MIRFFARLGFTGSLTGLIALAFWPYHDGVLRYGLPLSLVVCWATGLWLVWRWRFPRILLLSTPVILALPFWLPGKPPDTADLHARYVAGLRQFEGVPYLWGGESAGGIDCSGLPRRALRDALFDIGMRTGNGAAFRGWAEQWWYDTSAGAMARNYRGFTRPVGVAGKLRELDTDDLSAGDLAVTQDGRHVMVFLGDGKWIQADPGPWKVVIGAPATDPNTWFNTLVTVHRWMVLE